MRESQKEDLAQLRLPTTLPASPYQQGGRLRSDQVVAFDRIGWPLSVGIRIKLVILSGGPFFRRFASASSDHPEERASCSLASDVRHLVAEPRPCMRDLLIEFRKFRRPAQQRVGFAGVADEHRRVAQPPIAHLGGHRSPGYSFARLHHLGDRKTAAVAEIEGITRLASPKPIDGRDVGIGEVTDV